MKDFRNNTRLLMIITAIISVLLTGVAGALLATSNTDPLHDISLVILLLVLGLHIFFFRRFVQFINLSDSYNDRARLLIESFEAMDNVFHFIIDPDLKYLLINGSETEFMKKFYLKVPEVGHYATEYFPENILKGFNRDLQIAIDTKQHTTTNHFLIEGEDLYILSQYYALTNEKGEVYGVSVITTDVSDEVNERNEFIDMAYRDPLTDSYNRRKITEYYREFTQVNNIPTWIVVIDLNDFKEINDIYGHTIGDRMLTSLSWLLIDELPHHAMVARMGGDEFCALVTNVTEEELKESLTKIEVAAGDVGKYPLSISVGYFLAKRPKNHPFEYYYNKADQQMYLNKKEFKIQEVKRDISV